jgi:hypothetical protein
MGDLLQRLFLQDDILRHPLADDAPCPVLQYADDTLIIFRASVAAAARARLILDQFALATGLVINFTKSTMVSMHCGADLVEDMQKVLGCRVEGFPQTYLGLPLTCDKLKMAHFVPLIAKVDKYLSGWCSLLLSAGGRLVLLNAVLDALPAYAMGALALPPPSSKPLTRSAVPSSGTWRDGPPVQNAWSPGRVSAGRRKTAGWASRVCLTGTPVSRSNCFIGCTLGPSLPGLLGLGNRSTVRWPPANAPTLGRTGLPLWN